MIKESKASFFVCLRSSVSQARFCNRRSVAKRGLCLVDHGNDGIVVLQGCAHLGVRVDEDGLGQNLALFIRQEVQLGLLRVRTRMSRKNCDVATISQ